MIFAANARAFSIYFIRHSISINESSLLFSLFSIYLHRNFFPLALILRCTVHFQASLFFLICVHFCTQYLIQTIPNDLSGDSLKAHRQFACIDQMLYYMRIQYDNDCYSFPLNTFIQMHIFDADFYNSRILCTNSLRITIRIAGDSASLFRCGLNREEKIAEKKLF